MYSHKLTTLKNGLRLITVPMAQVESMTLMIGIATGSRYETKGTNGISHFLEHMMFKGTEKRPTTLDIATSLDNIGAEFNAATAKEFTYYHIKANAKYQDLAFDVLTDMVLHSKLDREEIEREKGVIIEEINMTEDTPMHKVAEVFESLLYSPTSLGWHIAGKKKNIRDLKRQDFIDYRQSFYAPANIVVVKAGKLTEKETLNLTEKYFGHLAAGEKNKLQPVTFTQTEPKIKLRHKETSQSHFCLGVPGYHHSHPDRYAIGVLSTILGGSMSSRMWIQVRERRGLAYYVRTAPEFFLDNGYLVTQAGVDINRLEETIKIVLEEYRKITAKKVDVQELKKAKEVLKGRLILEMEDSQVVAETYVLQAILEKEIRDPREIIDSINRVTTEDIQRVAKDIFRPEKLNLAVIGPYKEEGRFLKLLH